MATYLQSLYVVLWKPIYFTLGIAQGLLGCWLIKQIWPDPVQYAYAVAFLVAAPLAYVELECLARLLRLDSGPIVEWNRTTFIFVVGYAIALALAIGLAVHESSGRAAAEKYAAENEADKKRMRDTLNDPNVKRGMEAARAAQEARDAKK